MSGSSSLSVSEDAAGGRSLPSFTPVRRDASRNSDGKAESSTSGSKRSAHSSAHEESSAAQSPELVEDTNVNGANGTVRRSRPRNSGGFLLDAALHPRKAFLARSKKAGKENTKDGFYQMDHKGKRPSEVSDIVLPKRRAREAKHQKSLSIGGSPLATEVKQDTDNEGTSENGILAPGNDSRRSTFLQAGSTISPRYGTILGQPRPPMNVGYDTDPAQIVSMALSLNEKRRRQISGPRAVSGQSAGTRAMSGALSQQNSPAAQFTTPPRASPRFSLQTPEPESTKRTSVIRDQQQGSGSRPAALEEEDDEMDVSLAVSRATEMRVQKARTYFELAYEHRRVLSHLPPILRPSTSSQEANGKVYNPLQYSRNRKLRFSEKHPMAAEAEGWHDIDHVRAWVDKVIDAHTESRSDPEECVRLPDLMYSKTPENEDDGIEDGDPMLLDAVAPDFRKSSTQKTPKPTRPRSDWVTHPGDLIADAHWLEQGPNKLKIVDANGSKIYPPDTRLKFSGWRNRTPVDVPERLQAPTPPPDEPEADRADLPSPPPSALPELPTFTSTHGENRKRNRRKNTFKTNLGRDRKGIFSDGGSLNSSSSSSESDDERRTRGRKLFSRRRQNSEDGRIGVNWNLKSAPDRHSRRKDGSSGDHSFDQSAHSSKRPSVDHTRLSKLFTRDSRTDSSRNNSKVQSDYGRRDSANGPPSRASYDGGAAPRSSAEYDTTAPTSPIGTGFPSIAINLSPPQSRSPSPSKRNLPSILNPFRDRSHSKVREGIETNDFGNLVSQQQSRQSSNEADTGHESSDHASRGTSPMTRGISPTSKPAQRVPVTQEQQFATDDHRGSTVSRFSTKSTGTDGHTKVRGIFKGGRIAELVGNEVSKVGEYIWKRDIPTSARRTASTSSSLASYHASDSDEDLAPNGSLFKTPPQHEKRFPSSETDAQRAKRLSPTDSFSSPDSGGNADTRYNNPNLPSFTSPFERDRDAQEERIRGQLSSSNSPEESKEKRDHISQLAAEHRSAIKSPRLDRLAPPKLTLSRSTSPHDGFSVVEYNRQPSYGFGTHDRDFSQSRNASMVFNDALKTNGTAVTGLTSIDPTKSRSRSRVDLFRTTSHQSASSAAAAEPKDVSKRDISFTMALLLSSAVKAREIDLRANAIRNPPPQFLLSTLDPDHPTLHSPSPLTIRRKDEHLTAAHNLIKRIETDSLRFHTAVTSFQSSTVPSLHTALQALEDLVDNRLTPRVRASGDEAGELSIKLSTTSTLAVKDLNERIDGVMRRARRGPVRVLRRFGYLCVEWVVIVLLWAIWAVVTAYRVVAAVVGGVVRVGRWLLFLES